MAGKPVSGGMSRVHAARLDGGRLDQFPGPSKLGNRQVELPGLGQGADAAQEAEHPLESLDKVQHSLDLLHLRRVLCSGPREELGSREDALPAIPPVRSLL